MGAGCASGAGCATGAGIHESGSVASDPMTIDE